jgi:hypothetical protein
MSLDAMKIEIAQMIALALRAPAFMANALAHRLWDAPSVTPQQTVLLSPVALLLVI